MMTKTMKGELVIPERQGKMISQERNRKERSRYNCLPPPGSDNHRPCKRCNKFAKSRFAPFPARFLPVPTWTVCSLIGS
jgi:hypothetical protein